MRVVVTAVLAALALGCSGAPVEGDGGLACTPGESRACACPGGAAGTQVCADDGTRLEACVCDEVDGGSPPLDAGADGGPLPDDGGPLPVDAGSDAGTDAGPPLPSCVGEGVWRNTMTWCDDLSSVLAAYDCDLIFDASTGSSGVWEGNPTMVRTAMFILDYDGLTSYADRVYACHQPPPTEAYVQTCEIPLRRPCGLAEDLEQYRGGEDYRPICAAAEARGLAPLLKFNWFANGCR